MTEKEFIKTEAGIIVNMVLDSEDNYEARYAVEDRLQMVINLINLKTSHNEEGDDDGDNTSNDNGEGDTRFLNDVEYTVRIINDEVVVTAE